MARIPNSEIERLKNEVSVQRLIEASGVALKKTGKDFTGCCPFHEDDMKLGSIIEFADDARQMKA
jgi:DNA primase